MNYFVYQSLLYTGLVLYTWQRAQRSDLPFRVAWNLAFILMVFGFVGGRLFHVLYEYPDLYLEDPARIFRFWEGGFVFFGGFFMAAAASLFYLRREKESWLVWGDFYAPILAIGYAMGRIGCAIAGCCYGTFCDAPWALHGRHPTQLYAASTEFLLYLYLLKKEKDQARTGTVFALWLVGHGVGRLFMESYRADFRGSTVAGLSISSWVSLLLFGAGVALYTSIHAGTGSKGPNALR